MKIGYTVWTWMKGEFNRNWRPTDDAQRLFEQAAREISYLGYETIENFSFIVPVYEGKSAELKRLLDECKLEFVNVYHALSGDYAQDLIDIERCCRFMQENKISYLNIEAPHVPLDCPVSTEILDQMCAALDQMGAICDRYGVKACLHQHTRTLCETKAQLEYVVLHTNKENVHLCLDTCHLVLAGMDPVTEMALYIERLQYVHLKDVIADYKTPYFISVTENARPLGVGIIDFKAVIEALQKKGYDGPLTVEVDYPSPDSFAAAKISRQYLHDTVNL